MSTRVLVIVAAVIIVLALVAGTCEDCDTAARHFLRELFRAAF